MNMKTTIACALALMTIGCALPGYNYYERPAEQLAAKVRLGSDDVEGITYATSRDITRRSDELFTPYVYVAQRGRVTAISIQFSTDTGAWLFPERAYIGTPSRELKVDRIDSDVDCGRYVCHHTEYGRIILSDDDVRALIADAQDESIQMRLVGSTGGRANGGIRKAEIIATLTKIGIVDHYK